MKPAPCAYFRAESVEQVFDLLARYGEEARVLAGGQSLIATLNLRLSAPAVLVDINGLRELEGLSVEDGALRLGALTRQRALERSGDIARHARLIRMAMPYVAHPAIRNRGTLGGSIAFADPAAELPACAVALGAQIELQGAAGRRTVAASEFFRGLYDTDLRVNELVTAISVPLADDHRSGFAELARRHGDYAVVGLAAHAGVAEGALADARLVFFGVGVKPVLATAAGVALEGRQPDGEAVAAAQEALAEDLDPTDDLNASAAMKMHLARVLTARVLGQLADEAT